MKPLMELHFSHLIASSFRFAPIEMGAGYGKFYVVIDAILNTKLIGYGKDED